MFGWGASATATARAELISLAGGLPADELVPSASVAQALAAVADKDPSGSHRFPEATAALQRWVVRNLAARGATIEPARVIITLGAQHALALCAAALPERAIVAVGPETYPGALAAFASVGARVVATAGHVDAHYVIDGVANPYGTDRVAARRVELLASGLPMIVDEAYLDLRFDGRLARPLIADAPDRVWHVGTIAKTVGPGLRVGWLIPPREAHAAVLASAPAAALAPGSFAQAALAELLGDLDYDDLIDRARAAYAVRAERVVTALRRHANGVRFQVPEGGFSLWLDTDEAGNDADLVADAAAAGVAIDPGHLFRPGGSSDPVACRVSFSHAPLADLDEGVRRLAAALQTWRRRSFLRRAA